MRYYR